MYKLIFVVFVIFLNTIYAGIYPKHQVGIGFSSISGAGINYLMETNPENLFKLSLFYYYQGDDKLNQDINANLGLEYNYNIYKTEYNRFFALAGFSWWDIEKKRYSTYIENDITYEIKNIKINHIWNYGLGLGYEYRRKKFAVSLDIGYQYQISQNGYFGDIFNRSNGEDYFGPSAGISIRYIIK